MTQLLIAPRPRQERVRLGHGHLVAPRERVTRDRETTIAGALHASVEAGPASTRDALEQIQPFASLVGSLAALGLDDRIRSSRRVGENGEDLVFTITAFTGSGYVELTWRIVVEPDGEGASHVSISYRARATSKERLLESWSLLGPVAEQQSRRVLAAIREYAEEDA